MVPAAAVLTLALASPQQATLSRDFGIMRADLLIKAVASQTGWPLAGSPSLQRDYLYANVKGLTLDHAKDLLAAAVQGQWTQKGDLLELSSSHRALSLEDVRAQRSVESFFAKAPGPAPLMTADKAKELIRKAEDWKKAQERGGVYDWRTATELRSHAPMAKGCRAIAYSLGKSFWLSLASGDRVVFAEKPTRMQRALPPAGQAALSQMRQEIQMYALAIAEHGSSQEGGYWSDALEPYRYLPNELGPIDLIATSESGTVSLTMKVADKRGNYTVTSQTLLNAPETQSPGQAKPSPLPFAHLVEMVPASERLKKMREAIIGAPSSPASTQALEPLLTAFAEPAKQDPLNLILDEPFDRLVEKTGRGIIAQVPDTAIFRSAGGEVKYSDAAAWASFDPSSPRQRPTPVERGDNLALFPSDLSTARGGRFSRPAVAAALSSLRSSKPLLDVVTDYAANSPDMTTDQFLAILMMWLRQSNIPLINPRSKALLRIYGRLPGPVRSQAKAGGLSVAVSALPPDSQRDLALLVYSSGGGPAPLDSEVEGLPNGTAGSKPSAYDDPFEEMRAEYERSSFATEATRLLPNGLPADAKVTLVVSEAKVLFGQSSRRARGRVIPQPVSLESLATTQVMQEKGMEESSFGSPDIFYLGSSVALSLALDLGTARSTASLVLDQTSSSSKAMKLRDLPPDFQAAFARKVAGLRVRYKDVSVAPPTRGSTPP